MTLSWRKRSWNVKPWSFFPGKGLGARNHDHFFQEMIMAPKSREPGKIPGKIGKGHYVEAACNDDLATFNTSGFTAVVKRKTPPQPLTDANSE